MWCLCAHVVWLSVTVCLKLTCDKSSFLTGIQQCVLHPGCFPAADAHPGDLPHQEEIWVHRAVNQLMSPPHSIERHDTAENWHIFETIFFLLKWAASALPLSGFRLWRKSISHLGGEVCFCQTVLTSSGYASLIVKPSRWTHRSTVLSGFGSARCEGNRCICVKHGATCCSFFYSITYLWHIYDGTPVVICYK